MSPALNGSSVIWRFKCGDPSEIRNGITLGFYTRLTYAYIKHHLMKNVFNHKLFFFKSLSQVVGRIPPHLEHGEPVSAVLIFAFVLLQREE